MNTVDRGPELCAAAAKHVGFTEAEVMYLRMAVDKMLEEPKDSDDVSVAGEVKAVALINLVNGEEATEILPKK